MTTAAATATIAVDHDAALVRLLRFLNVPGVTGQEAAIASDIRTALLEVGVPEKQIRHDTAHERIPLPTQTGNLWVHLPGRKKGPHRLFMTHMDTVPLCAGAQPQHKGRKIIGNGTTALGGDNRTGCAVLVTLADELRKQKLAHPPITLLFTVREESGLFGARHLDPADLAKIEVGYNFDGRSASDVIIGAVGAERWEVEIVGRAAHAGVAPEQGISATLVAALAIAKVHAGGWFGKVNKGDQVGTSNVGPFGGKNGQAAGDATNVVTDYVHLKGESRSHDKQFVKAITAAYKEAFRTAADQVTNHEGKSAKVKFTAQNDYGAFKLKENAPVVQHAITVLSALGLKPNPRTANGGLDANWLVKHGLPVVTLGAGQNQIHTIDEWVDLDEYDKACRVAVALATL